ncbi:hypothetical protein B484DRAFT_463886 [Ochromonadaceae sp. CCMP2298]|nr:hypothetical protein B484DRAFT_463886 [Ochromonadaceae sp. CCMP2298]
MGGSLQGLKFELCDFGNEAVDIGNNCDALTVLFIANCSSTLHTAPGDSLGCTHLLWGILPKCADLKRFCFHGNTAECASLGDRDLCLLARFCPHLAQLHIQSQRAMFGEAALSCVAVMCTKLKNLKLLVPTAFTDRTVDAIAANLVSLRKLHIHNLQLRKPCTLRGLAEGCRPLQELCITKGNAQVTEAELLYLVKHTQELRLLAIGKWEHLDFRDRWDGIQPHASAAEDLLRLGIGNS